MDVLRGKVKDIVFKHDASRIVQTAVKWGGAKERNEIAEELKGQYKELAQSKYSKVRPLRISCCRSLTTLSCPPLPYTVPCHEAHPPLPDIPTHHPT